MAISNTGAAHDGYCTTNAHVQSYYTVQYSMYIIYMIVLVLQPYHIRKWYRFE